MRNSKDGIARYVGRQPHIQGWIFRCTESYVGPEGAAWRVDPPCPYPGKPGRFASGIYDAVLEPLADPGENEVDARDIKLGEAMRAQVPAGADA